MLEITRSQTLPSLDKFAVSTPVLSLKIHRPTRMPKAVDAWHYLQRVQRIDVEPTTAADATAYSISIYLRHDQHRIPTNNLRVTESTALLSSTLTMAPGSPAFSATPDLQVVRTFAEMDKLRKKIWVAARQYHPVYCELCDPLAFQMLTKLSQPALLMATIHRSPAKRAKRMRTFLMHLLTELHVRKPQCAAACKGQAELPILLHGFLFGDEEDPTE